MLYQALYMASPGFCKGILVDYRGMRMIAEDSYGSWIGRAVKEQSEAGAYVILADPTGSKKAKLPSWLKPAVGKPTLGKLATALKMSPHVLTKTVEDYNAMAAHKMDPEFHKSKGYLVPQAKAPLPTAALGDRRWAVSWRSAVCGSTRRPRCSAWTKSPSSGCTRPAATAAPSTATTPAAARPWPKTFTFGRIAGQQVAVLTPYA